MENIREMSALFPIVQCEGEGASLVTCGNTAHREWMSKMSGKIIPWNFSITLSWQCWLGILTGLTNEKWRQIMAHQSQTRLKSRSLNSHRHHEIVLWGLISFLGKQMLLPTKGKSYHVMRTKWWTRDLSLNDQTWCQLERQKVEIGF